MANDSNHVEFPPLLQRELGKFFRSVAFEARNRTVLTPDIAGTFSDENGYVLLTNGEVSVYNALITKLEGIYPYSKKYGKSYAGATMRAAITTAGGRAGDPRESAKKALEAVLARYKIPLMLINVYIPVSGFELHRRTTWDFGKVKFLKITNQNFRTNVLQEAVLSQVRVSYFAHVAVKAADHESAIKLARRVVELHCTVLDSLSVIAGSTRPGDENVFSSYMAVGESVHSLTITEREGLRGWSRCKTVSLGGFTPHVLRGSSFIRRFHWQHINRQLRVSNSTLFTERLLPALKWIGRAASQRSSEEIFLYYCLALEAIYFETQFNGRLVDELRRRIHKHHFTNTSWMGSVVVAFNRFSHLYDLRSHIVHRGGVEVSDNEVGLMRSLAIGSMYKMLHHRRFRSVKSAEDFEKWLRSDSKELSRSKG